MNRQRRAWLQRTAVLGAGAALAPGLLGCNDEPPLTVAYHPWPGYAPLKLADSLGWWDDGRLRGLPTGSASASRVALAEGRAQAAALTLDETLLAVADGLPLHVVALFNLSHGADVVLAKPGFTDRTRWVGARLGHETGAVGELMTASWLEYAGLRAEDVTGVHLTADEHLSAWKDGRVDLLVTFEPTASRLESLGAKRLFDSSQLPPERPIADVLAIRADAWRRRRAALRTMVRQIFAAQRHLMTLPVDAAYRLAPWLDVPHAAAMLTFSGLRLTNWADNRQWLIGQPAPLQRAAEGLASFMGRVNMLGPLRLPDDLVTGSALPAEEPL